VVLIICPFHRAYRRLILPPRPNDRHLSCLICVPFHSEVGLIVGKLREALISLRKRDTEAHDILVASVKVGILSRHNETYLPALRTLLDFPSYPPEIKGWYSLYLLFVLEDPFEFYTFTSMNPVDSYYERLALALINRNYIAYAKLTRKGTRFDKALILGSPGDVKMKQRVVDVVGKCYYKVEVEWFNQLSKTNLWEQEDNMYIIRRPLQKTQKAG
jgi:hypothetical protein